MSDREKFEIFRLRDLKLFPESDVDKYCIAGYMFGREQLQKRIAELETENAKLNDTFFGNMANRLAVKNERLLIDCNNLMSENFKLKAREKKLIKGLEFYADNNTYTKGEFGMYLDDSDCFLDDYVNQARSTEYGGKIARDILKEIKGE